MCVTCVGCVACGVCVPVWGVCVWGVRVWGRSCLHGVSSTHRARINCAHCAPEGDRKRHICWEPSVWVRVLNRWEPPRAKDRARRYALALRPYFRPGEGTHGFGEWRCGSQAPAVGGGPDEAAPLPPACALSRTPHLPGPAQPRSPQGQTSTAPAPLLPVTVGKCAPPAAARTTGLGGDPRAVLMPEQTWPLR